MRTAALLVLCVGAAGAAWQVLFASAAPQSSAISGTIRRASAHDASLAAGTVPPSQDSAHRAAALSPGAQSAASRRRLVGAGALAGAMLAAAAGFLWLRRRRSPVATGAGLQANFPELRLLGALPTVPVRRMRESVGGTVNIEPFAGALGRISELLKADPLRGCPVILIAAPRCGAGKTTFALNLASRLACAARVMLVDADLRSAGLSHRLGLPRHDAGLTELISQSAPYRSCLAQTATPRLHAIRSGALPKHPEEMLGSARMAQMLRLARRYYDHIVIDSPGILEHPDACVAAGCADGVILVADGRYGCARDVARAVELLKSVNANILGIVLNHASR